MQVPAEARGIGPTPGGGVTDRCELSDVSLLHVLWYLFPAELVQFPLIGVFTLLVQSPCFWSVQVSVSFSFNLDTL